jgi:hypothetical protein
MAPIKQPLTKNYDSQFPNCKTFKQLFQYYLLFLGILLLVLAGYRVQRLPGTLINTENCNNANVVQTM